MKLKINEKELVINATNEGAIKINKELEDFNISKINNERYHIIYQDKSFDITIIKQSTKHYRLNVNGINYEVEIINFHQKLLDILGISSSKNQQKKEVIAPMPGKVLEVFVKEGDVINENDSLLILEAMKMENNIKSPMTGEIKAVRIHQNDTVQKNELLITFK